MIPKDGNFHLVYVKKSAIGNFRGNSKVNKEDIDNSGIGQCKKFNNRCFETRGFETAIVVGCHHCRC